jgi:hypothetical protein
MSNEYGAIVARAESAGLAAGEAVAPRPMVVVGGVPGGEQKKYFVSEGVCGFAWITIRPGNSAFARYLKKVGKASKAYGGGVQVWVGQFNQSMQRKEAYANAYAAVLREAGVNAYAGSRMD